MKDKKDMRRELLSGESNLELFAKQLYIERFRDAKEHLWWESKRKWGLPGKD